MTQLSIDSLVLEVTRWCDLECKHCLRGKRQRKSMQLPVIEALARNEIYIHGLAITGGEPRFGHKMLAEAAWKLNYGSVWLKTNGNKFSRKLADAYLLAWDKAEDNEISGFQISGDQFHPENRSVYYQYLEYFEEQGYTELVNHDKFQIRSVIAAGNAAEWGDRPGDSYTISDIKYENYRDNICISEPYIYINYRGDVSLGCDRSFQNIDANSLGNILNKPLIEILGLK